MNCEKCRADLPYGAKYCGECGEKIPKGAYDAEYNDTVWAKIDNAKDKYDKFFLKKITGNIVFKIVSMVLVLVYFFFTLYGNFMGIRLKENESYDIKYNKTSEEYYVYPKTEASNLELYVPLGTDKIIFTAIDGEQKIAKKYTVDEYKENGYSIAAEQYDCIYVESMRNGKATDRVKLIVASN